MARPQQNMARSTKHGQPGIPPPTLGYTTSTPTPGFTGQHCRGTQPPPSQRDEETAPCAQRGPRRSWAVSGPVSVLS